MKVIPFAEQNVVIGEGQEDVYNTIPANMNEADAAIPVTFCVELDDEEKKQVNETGQVWITVLSFGAAFHPISSSFLKPEFPVKTQFGDRNEDAGCVKSTEGGSEDVE